MASGSAGQLIRQQFPEIDDEMFNYLSGEISEPLVHTINNSYLDYKITHFNIIYMYVLVFSRIPIVIVDIHVSNLSARNIGS